jgi:hypothetical protein
VLVNECTSVDFGYPDNGGIGRIDLREVGDSSQVLMVD